MKRARGEKGSDKKRVRFAEEQNEIIPEDEDAVIEDTESNLLGQAANTKQPVDADTEWLEDVQSGEEKFFKSNDPGDGEVPLEPFNLDEERQFGTFEDDGFYVENKTEKSEASDAWLSASDAVVCSIDVLRKHEAQQRALAEAEKAPKPSMAQTLDLKKRMAALLQPRETVLSGLRRLAKKNPKSGATKQKDDMREFNELTELADALLDTGEIDAYSMYKEEFEHSVQAMRQTTFDGGDPPDADDMFAEESDKEDNVTESKTDTTSHPQTQLAGPKVANVVVPEKTVEVDFASWPISELKRFLTERNVDCSSVVEKHDLVQKATEAQQSRIQPVSYQAPEGFVYHPSSGYFYNAEHGLYYDGPSRCFYDPRTQKWFDENWNELKRD